MDNFMFWMLFSENIFLWLCFNHNEYRGNELRCVLQPTAYNRYLLYKVMWCSGNDVIHSPVHKKKGNSLLFKHLFEDSLLLEKINTANNFSKSDLECFWASLKFRGLLASLTYSSLLLHVSNWCLLYWKVSITFFISIWDSAFAFPSRFCNILFRWSDLSGNKHAPSLFLCAEQIPLAYSQTSVTRTWASWGRV